MQPVQHNGVSSTKIKNFVSLLFRELKTWAKCRYFDQLNYNRVPRESLQCIYLTDKLTFQHCQYNSMPSEMILGTFHPPQFYTVHLSLSYSTFSFSVFPVQRDFLTNIMFGFLQQFTWIMFYTCLCLDSEYSGQQG